MVSHPETGSDSPIGSDQDRGRDIVYKIVGPKSNLPLINKIFILLALEKSGLFKMIRKTLN